MLTSASTAAIAPNAKHGIYSSPAVLKEENPEVYLAIQEDYYKLFNPVDVYEEDLVDLIVSFSWRLKRTRYVETEMIREKTVRRDCGMAGAIIRAFKDKDFATKLSQYEMRLLRGLERTIEIFYVYRNKKLDLMEREQKIIK